jgi:hypothetical protein
MMYSPLRDELSFLYITAICTQLKFGRRGTSNLKHIYPTTGIQFPAETRVFLFVTALRPALGPTQFAIRYVPYDLSPRVKPPGGVLAEKSTSPYVFVV